MGGIARKCKQLDVTALLSHVSDVTETNEQFCWACEKEAIKFKFTVEVDKKVVKIKFKVVQTKAEVVHFEQEVAMLQNMSEECFVSVQRKCVMTTHEEISCLR